MGQLSPYEQYKGSYHNQLGVADTLTERLLARRQALRAGYEAQPQEIAIDPAAYRLGPGDGVYIDVFSARGLDQDLTVTPEGRLIIPQTGTLNVAGMTVTEAEKKVNDLLRRNYKNPDASLSLRRLRPIKVSVIGSVLAPGMYTTTAASRVNEVIDQAGGFLEKSSLRNIEIRDQQGKLRTKVDMQRYMIAGDLEANPVIESGDVVLIPHVTTYVTISGAVNFPGQMEFAEGDRLSTLIKIARGLQSNALLDSVEIARFSPNDPIQARRFYVDMSKGDDPELQDGDAISIRSRSQYRIPTLVSIAGEVHHPGKYSIELGTTRISDILTRAGGVLETASLEDAVVLRRVGIAWENDPEYIMLDRLMSTKVSANITLSDEQFNYYIANSRRLGRSVMVVNFRSLIREGDASQNILLREEDSIWIPRTRGYVSVLGNVANPGNIMYNPRSEWKDYIRFAGGFTSGADEDEVRIINSKTSTYINPRSDDDYKIGPGDTIVIPPEKHEFWKNFQTVSAITAQVLTIVAGILLLTRR